MEEEDGDEIAGIFGTETDRVKYPGDGYLRSRKCLIGLAGNPVLMIHFGIKLRMKLIVICTFTHLISQD